MAIKHSKVTKIEKKYKDKKTGEMKSMTINYSKVKDRLLEFRQDCPRGSIVPSYAFLTDRIIFSCHIMKDKSDPGSAEARGHATGKDDGTEKIFEKLETIATGRALALLGYGAEGEIASSEEMEAFEESKQLKAQDEINEITEKIGQCKSDYALAKYWLSLPGIFKTNPAVFLAKEEKKKSFKEVKKEAEVAVVEEVIEEEKQ